MTYREWFIADAPMVVIGAQLTLAVRVLLPTQADRIALVGIGVVSLVWIAMRLYDKWSAARGTR